MKTRPTAGADGAIRRSPRGALARGARRFPPTERSGDRRPLRGRRRLAGLGPDDLVAAGADADQRDRAADGLGDVRQVVAGGLRQILDLAALRDVVVPARKLLVVTAHSVQDRLVVRE